MVFLFIILLCRFTLLFVFVSFCDETSSKGSATNLIFFVPLCLFPFFALQMLILGAAGFLDKPSVTLTGCRAANPSERHERESAPRGMAQRGFVVTHNSWGIGAAGMIFGLRRYTNNREWTWIIHEYFLSHSWLLCDTSKQGSVRSYQRSVKRVFRCSLLSDNTLHNSPMKATTAIKANR